MFNVNSLFVSASHCRPNLTNYIGLRWRTRPRKPFWLGIAKTKLFRIPEKKQDPPEQLAELKRLYYIYNRQMRALHNFMLGNVSQHLEEEAEMDLSDRIEKSKLLHESWNAESARLREERLKKEEQERMEAILQRIKKNQENIKEIGAKVEKIVEKEIEISNTYITKENLDEAIDKCLASVSDYNYALDLSGNVYKGNSMKPGGKINEMMHESADSKGTESPGDIVTA